MQANVAIMFPLPMGANWNKKKKKKHQVSFVPSFIHPLLYFDYKAYYSLNLKTSTRVAICSSLVIQDALHSLTIKLKPAIIYTKAISEVVTVGRCQYS